MDREGAQGGPSGLLELSVQGNQAGYSAQDSLGKERATQGCRLR